MHGEDSSNGQGQRAVDVGFDAFYILDAVRDGAARICDFVYTQINMAGARRINRPREAILGKRATELFPLEQITPWIERYAQVVERQEPYEEETLLKLSGVGESWVRYHVMPLGDGVAVTSRDISQQKAEEAALRRSHDLQMAHRLRAEERFTQLMASGVMAISISEPRGRIFEVNEAFAELVGRSREELLSPGFNGLALATPSSPEDVEQTRRELETRGASRLRERELIHRDGKTVPVLMGVVRLGPEELMICATDLSETKRTERALQQAQEQLRQSQKMEAIGSLAGGVAHDFNNLLSIILSYGELIESGLSAGDPIRSDVTEIIAAGRRASELTKQLLAFSRKQILKPRVVVLNALVASLERMLRRLIGENIEFTVLPARDLGLVSVDPTQVEQVVMNLVVNSRDAMPHGGKLTIETKNVVLDEAYAREHVGVSTPGKHVMISVSDSGIGMDAATRARAFEPFFTTKGPGKGTGLGLSTVFGIVKQSGGHIWVESEPGAGTTFKVYFPRVEAPASRLEPEPVPEALSSHGSETILLVEDEERVRALARTVLKRHGYQVLEAQSGGDALLICEQHPRRIDLLLTDFVMPRMTGRALAERLCTVRPDMKVLYMSGYADNSIVHHGVLDSTINFLEKPLTVDALTRKVREVLDAKK